MPTPIASPSSTQAPFTAPVLVPTLGATPTPAATPTPTLSAAAPPIVLTQVDRRALPRVVVLLKPRVFAILDSQGRSIGSVDAAAGIRVDLVGIVDDQRVEVRMGSSLQVIPAAETDIVPRIRTELKHLVPLGNAAGDAAVSGTGLRG